MKNISITVNAPFQIEYSTSPDGKYSLFTKVISSHGRISIDELISNVRRILICSPSFVRQHVPAEIVEWTARFWFRFSTPSGHVYFFVDIHSSDLNSISSRFAAL